ncbi:MAG: hypothetical protein IPN19_07455 [Elusimicrobia bacterium]|nr:hypothetical protein [Elusimicrobiota bacterium]
MASGETRVNFATPGRLAGAKSAVQFLKDQGISLSRRRDILSTFEIGTIKLRYAGKNEFGIRYFDDLKAGARGHFLFKTFPATREGMALKTEWIQIKSMKQWQIEEGTIIIEGVAAQQGHWSGGSKQMFILNKRNLKEVPKR